MKNYLKYKRNINQGILFSSEAEVREFFKDDEKLIQEYLKNNDIGGNNFNNSSQKSYNPPKDLYEHNLDNNNLGQKKPE